MQFDQLYSFSVFELSLDPTYNPQLSFDVQITSFPSEVTKNLSDNLN